MQRKPDLPTNDDDILHTSTPADGARVPQPPEINGECSWNDILKACSVKEKVKPDGEETTFTKPSDKDDGTAGTEEGTIPADEQPVPSDAQVGSGSLPQLNKRKDRHMQPPSFAGLYAHSKSSSSSNVDKVVKLQTLNQFWTDLTPTVVDVYEQKIEAFFTLSDVVTVNNRMEEIEASWMKADMEDFYESKGSETMVIGYCYAIWNSLFADLIKIGMTRRTPEIRVRELSGAGLPEPFEIVAILPCTNPFKMERAIHAHYASIRKYGKKKEFFTLSRTEVAVYFGSLIANAMQDPPAPRLRKRRTLKSLQAEIDELRVENANLKALYAHMT